MTQLSNSFNCIVLFEGMHAWISEQSNSYTITQLMCNYRPSSCKGAVQTSEENCSESQGTDLYLKHSNMSGINQASYLQMRKMYTGEHSVASVPASLSNLTKSVPDPYLSGPLHRTLLDNESKQAKSDEVISLTDQAM